MIFGWVMPLLFGVIANALLPTAVGVSDLVLPRVNSVGLWLLLDAVLLLLVCQVIPAPVGWTIYPPLSAVEGAGVDWCIISLHIAGVSSIVLAINLLTTTYCTYQARLPWRAISLVFWSTSVANVLLVLTLPALAAAITMLLLDRRVNTGFYSVEHGGEPILYQHLFWFFGHPEVYVLVLPAFGYTSYMLTAESRGSMVNSSAMTLALLTIGSVSMVVYGHHLYTTGLSADDRVYYSFATYLIAIPTGVKYFTWLSTLNVSCMFHNYASQAATGFLWYFAIGGLTGVVLADGALDEPLHDAYYVVAHFHLVMGVAIMYAAAGLILTESSMIWS